MILSLTFQVLSRFISPQHWRGRQILQNFAIICLESLPVITLSTAFAGMLITHEMAWHMDSALQTHAMIPGFTGQFILRELGIAVPALLLVAKVGASITAEVATMKITEQLDALKLLGINPIDYLVFPKFIAAMASGACLTLIAMTITSACSLGVAVVQYHFSIMEYLNALRHFIGPKDLFFGLMKGTIYAGVIPLISCSYGFRCQGGAEAVGTATTQAVVNSTLVIISLDFFLTYLFKFLV